MFNILKKKHYVGEAISIMYDIVSPISFTAFVVNHNAALWIFFMLKLLNFATTFKFLLKTNS